MELPFYYPLIYNFLMKGEITMKENEFIELYLKANEDTRKAIVDLLEDIQPSSELPEVPADNERTIA